VSLNEQERGGISTETSVPDANNTLKRLEPELESESGIGLLAVLDSPRQQELETHVHRTYDKEGMPKEVRRIKDFALRGDLSQLPPSTLTKENVEKLESHGITLPFIASIRGKIGCVPEEFLSHQKMLAETMGYNALELCKIAGIVHQLPNSLLTEEFLKIKKGPLEPNLYHTIAEEGQLGKIPRPELKEEYLLLYGSGKNSYHVAAFNGTFKDIPKELITTKALLSADCTGRNVLHHLASSKSLREVNPKFLTECNLLTTCGSSGYTVAHLAAKNGCLRDIPKISLTRNLLLTKDKSTETTVIELLNSENLNKLLSVMDHNNLVNLYQETKKWIKPSIERALASEIVKRELLEVTHRENNQELAGEAMDM